MPFLFICKLCEFESADPAISGRHIRFKHHLSTKEYYDKYIDSATNHKCLFCVKEAKFVSLGKGYNITCGSLNCSQKQIENTKLEKYGNAHYQNREKANETLKKRYGDDYFKKQSKKAHEKLKQLNYHKGDRPQAWNKGLTKETSESMMKVSKTLTGKLVGDKNGMFGKKHTAEALEKMRKRHSAPHIQKYYYNDIGFDSKLEVKFFEKLRYLGFEPEVLNQTVRIPFTDSNGKQHSYCPDFRINDKLIEIKTKASFNEKGILFNFRAKDRSSDYVYEAKYNCMLSNNIIIFTEDDLKDDTKILEKLK